MSYLRGVGETGDFDVEAALRRQEERLAKIQDLADKELFYRKIATGAAIIGGLMALTKLSDIWRAVKSRRGRL